MLKGLLKKLRDFLIEDLPPDHLARDGVVIYEHDPRSGRVAICLERGGEVFLVRGLIDDAITLNRGWTAYAADQRLDFDWHDAAYMSRITRELCNA